MWWSAGRRRSAIHSSACRYLADQRLIDVDLILEQQLRRLIPNKQRKVKLKVRMNPLPTLQSLRQQIIHAYPNLKNIPYGLRFVIPHKVLSQNISNPYLF